MSIADPPLLDPSTYRGDFPILDSTIHGKFPLAYLDNAATTQRPRQVIDKVTEMSERHYANVHRGIHWLSDQSSTFYEQVREKVQSFIGAEHLEEVIFTSGATAAVNTVARSWGDANVRAGDEILLTEMEHHSNIVPWQQLAERTGCTIKWLPIDDFGELCLDRLDEFLTDRTKLVAVTAVSNVLGTMNPLDEIIAKAHAAGALVLVDAAQQSSGEVLAVAQQPLERYRLR